MKYFVLIYDRPARTVIELQEFTDQEREQADAYRLKAQRTAIREHLDQEIVLFHAASREALQRTHGSYFFSSRELLDRVKAAV